MVARGPGDRAPLEIGRVASPVLGEPRSIAEGVAQPVDPAQGRPKVQHLAVHLERTLGRRDDGAVLEPLLGAAAGERLGLRHGPPEGAGLPAPPDVLAPYRAAADGDEPVFISPM